MPRISVLSVPNLSDIFLAKFENESVVVQCNGAWRNSANLLFLVVITPALHFPNYTVLHFSITSPRTQ